MEIEAMKKIVGLILTLVLLGSVALAEADLSQVADASDMTDVVDVVEAGMVPVTAEQLNDGVYEVAVESSSSMFKIVGCALTVEDGADERILDMLTAEGLIGPCTEGAPMTQAAGEVARELWADALREREPFRWAVDGTALELAIGRLACRMVIELDSKVRAAVIEACRAKSARREPFASRAERVRDRGR